MVTIEPMAEEYYAEEFSALPYALMARLFKRMLPPFVAYPLAAWFRLRYRIGRPPRPMYAIGPVGSGRFVSREELPPQVTSRWAPLLEQLHDLNFRPVYYTLGGGIGAKETAAALFLDQSGSTFASLQWLRMQGEGIEEDSPLEFDSFRSADPEILTGMMADKHLLLADAFKIPFVEQEYLSNSLGVRRGYQRHLDRIRDGDCLAFPQEAAADEFKKRNQRRFDWLRQQGFLRRLSPAEIERVKQCRLP